MRTFFRWSLKNGKRVSSCLSEKKRIPPVLHVKYQLSNLIIFRKLREAMGGELQCFISGGAPLSIEIAHFFNAAGLLILEGYGATETAAPATWNHLENYKFGSVGLPIEGTEVKIAEDGEVLIKGPGVFQGYWQLEEETEHTLNSDGWYQSGDIGYIDDEGFLYIIDRKKELIITAAGKNISPARIENVIKGGSVYISNIMACGDRKKFVSALVTLDMENLKQKVTIENVHKPSEVPEVVDLISKEIERLNKTLAKFEQVKKFRIIDKDFSIEEDLLTPSMKLRRKRITERYSQKIEEMYDQKLSTLTQK